MAMLMLINFLDWLRINIERQKLPAGLSGKMGEGLVGFSHAMSIVAFFNGRALILRGG